MILTFHQMRDWKAAGIHFDKLQDWMDANLEGHVEFIMNDFGVRQGYKFEKESDVILFTLYWS